MFRAKPATVKGTRHAVSPCPSVSCTESGARFKHRESPCQKEKGGLPRKPLSLSVHLSTSTLATYQHASGHSMPGLCKHSQCFLSTTAPQNWGKGQSPYPIPYHLVKMLSSKGLGNHAHVWNLTESNGR